MKKNRLAFVKMNFRHKKVEEILLILVVLCAFVFSISFLANFIVNTKQLFGSDDSDAIFMNNDSRRMIIKRKDEDLITDSDLKKIKSIDHMGEVDKYPLAAEFNYFYQNGIDFAYEGFGGNDEKDPLRKDVILLKKEHFVRSASCLTEDDLRVGRLPESSDEIVLYSKSDNWLSKRIQFFFNYYNGWFNDEFIGQKMQVVGILKEDRDQVYFYDLFCDVLELNTRLVSKWNVMDHMPSYDQIEERRIPTARNNLIISGGTPYYGREFAVNATAMKHILDKHEFYIVLSDETEKEFPLGRNDKNQKNALMLFGISMRQTMDGPVPNYSNSKCKSFSITVSDDVGRIMASNYKRNEVNAYIDDYVYNDEILKKLDGMGYDAVNVRDVTKYYDKKKINKEDLITCLKSFGVLVALFPALFMVVQVVFKIKTKQSMTLLSVGMKIEDLFFFQKEEVLTCTLIGMILGGVLNKILEHFLPTLFQYTMSIIKFYHVGLLVLIEGAIIMLGLKIYQKKLKKMKKSGLALIKN